MTDSRDLSGQEAYDIASIAYKYAYPIVTMDISSHQSTNVPDSRTVPMRAPVNQFVHARKYPGANDRDVVRLNFDTLYSVAWLDLAKEPMILTIPDTTGRYFMMPMLDMWTDVFVVIGTRTVGSRAGVYAIVAPGWTGKLPPDVQTIVAPTPNVWVVGRTQADGPADYGKVHAIQDGYTLTPLSQWNKAYTPTENVPIDLDIDNKTPPLYQVNKIDGVAMLTRLAALLQKQPPHGNDYPILFQLKRLGLEPGKPFDASRLSAEMVKTINTAARDALKELETAGKSGKGLTVANGWIYTDKTVGTYGTSYALRAQAALIGLGVNLPEDAIYPASFVDGDGRPYRGSERYLLHFDGGSMPPAEAFWSVTLYDKDGFQVANPLDRFAVGSHFGDNKLMANADGSIDIHIQNESPGKDKESNWLPTPKGEFNLCLRLYSPTRAMRDGNWVPPPVQSLPSTTNATAL